MRLKDLVSALFAFAELLDKMSRSGKEGNPAEVNNTKTIVGVPRNI